MTKTNRDRSLISVAAALRAVSTGMAAVLLGVYLALRGLSPETAFAVIASGLGGAALAALLVTVWGDRIGRRRALIALAVLGAAGLGAVALSAEAAPLGLAAFLGMVNGMGRDRGAALILEQAILPSTIAATGRTRAFAWYNVLQDGGLALGALLAGLPGLLERTTGEDSLTAHQVALGASGLILLASGAVSLRLSRASEVPRGARPVRLSPQSRRRIGGLAALFALDGLGSGFLATALLSYLFFERFAVATAWIGGLFLAARLLNAASHVAAAALAARIGLVNTMVFTHVPSSLLLITVAFTPSFPIAALLFLLREALVEMDVPTRQSYVMALVEPHERTAASGITHLVRLVAWAVGPILAGAASSHTALMTPLVIGAGLKLLYDLLLYLLYRRIKPAEEM